MKKIHLQKLVDAIYDALKEKKAEMAEPKKPSCLNSARHLVKN